MAFDKANLAGYVEVKDRIVSFLKDHPEGVFQSEVVFHKDWDGEYWAWREKKVKVGRCGLICVKGRVFRSPDDKLPAEGHSWMQTPGVTPYTEGSEVENAETSAWGRALATMGYGITKSLASIDEIRNKSHNDFLEGGPQLRSGPHDGCGVKNVHSLSECLSQKTFDELKELRAQGAGADSVGSPPADPAPAALSEAQIGMVKEQFAIAQNALGRDELEQKCCNVTRDKAKDMKWGAVETWPANVFEKRYEQVKKWALQAMEAAMKKEAGE